MRVGLTRTVLLLVPVLAWGCTAPQAEFVASEATHDLMPPARRAIQATLRENFGTPHELVAWLKLPVDFGRIEGVVQAGTLDGEGNRVKVALKSEAGDLAATGLLFMSGSYQGAAGAFHVAAYDASAQELILNENFEVPPAAGDQFLIVGHRLQQGRHLYMRHCMHCHGVSGDGDGPTAKYLNPRPRDYRQGLFKFTSTKTPEKATRDDLQRIIQQGIPGTYMPAFHPALDTEEVLTLVEYIRWLALRGELENRLVLEFAADFSNAAYTQRREAGESREAIDEALTKFIQSDYPGLVGETATDLAAAWDRAETPESVVLPKQARKPDSVASRANGRKLFIGDKAKCIQCHGPTGRGDGSQTEDFQKKTGSNETYAERGLHDHWHHKITPRDLTTGIFRGGRRPLDVYRRIAAGIKGTPMPGSATALTEDEIWDLVNYVLYVPFEDQSPQAMARRQHDGTPKTTRSADAEPVRVVSQTHTAADE